VLTLLLAPANAVPGVEQPAAGASLEFNKEDGTLCIDWSGPILAGMADDLRAALDKYGFWNLWRFTRGTRAVPPRNLQSFDTPSLLIAEQISVVGQVRFTSESGQNSTRLGMSALS